MAAAPTVGSYLASFATGPAWLDGAWPPDVFALANLVLDATEAYRFAVAPPAGRRWPPSSGWVEDVTRAARAWRAAEGQAGGGAPGFVRRELAEVARRLDEPLTTLRDGRDQQLCEAFLTLHAVADEACRGLAANEPASAGTFEARAWALLAERRSLSRIDPLRVRVTPKTHFSQRGMTVRSLSRYLALNYEPIEVNWERLELPPGTSRDRRHFNLLLLPWPLALTGEAFRPIVGPLEMDRQAFGFFEFAPTTPFDLELLADLLSAGQRTTKRIDALVLPEAAVEPSDVPSIERLLATWGVTFLIAGVRVVAPADRLGGNYVHLGVRTADGWVHFEQAKHHRWCLDPSQIRQYHLSRSLDPSRLWWEGIDLPVRSVQVIDVGGGATTAPLVCEDLARLDEVADVLRRIGPSLVVALLLDGPQLVQRWSCRYATILADDPGSAVLTLTALGMVARSRPPGRPPSRAVALWSDPTSGVRELHLARGATGMLLTTVVGSRTVWTADGRRHEDNTPQAVLAGVHQLRLQRTRASA